MNLRVIIKYRVCLTVLLALMLLPVSSYSQFLGQRIRGIEVQEQGYSVNIEANTIKTNTIMTDGLQVSIKLIDPSSLDKLFFDLSRVNGKLSYSVFDTSRDKYFLKRKRKRSKTKSDSEFLYDGIQWLLQNGMINDTMYEKVYSDITDTYDEEEENLEPIELKSHSYNPYYLGDKYLSVFEIILSNNTNQTKSFNDLIQLKIGDNSLKPLTNSQIISLTDKFLDKDFSFGVRPGLTDELILLRSSLERNTYSKLQGLERYNLENFTIIPANTKIKKYFAVLPLDMNAGSFDINIIGDNSSSDMHWDITKHSNSVNDKYFYYELIIKSEVNNSTTDYNYFDILNNDVDARLSENVLYVKKEDINKTIKLFRYSKTTNDKLLFGTNQFKASDYLILDKNRRHTIDFELNEIEGISKKNKKQ